MPFETRYYKLEAFQWGDVYSSRVDERRFTIIDNQLAFLSDMVTAGVVYGWDITDNEDGTISIAPGLGMIGRRIVQSFGGFEVTLSGNTIHYLYMEAKEGEVGGTSGNSNMVSVVGIDEVAPSSPANLQQESSTVAYLASLDSYDSDFLAYLKRLMGRLAEDDDIELVPYKEVAFSWDANTEVDFSYYSILKEIDAEYGVFEEISTTTELIYVDINLEQDILYTYQVVAVDLSGNRSNPSEIEISTSEDSRIPAPPRFVQVFPSDETLEVIWDHSPTDNVVTYRITIQPLDSSYNNEGSSTTVDIDASDDSEFGSTYTVFENLENNRNYDITVYALSVANNLSDGITVRTLLKYLPGAGEVNDINVEFTISSFANVGVETTLVWRYQQEDPYLPYAEKFLVTFVENGTRFSEPIEVLESIARLGSCPDGNNEEGICYRLNVKYIPYSVGGELQYESIKEYTPYFIIIQTVDEDDNTSNGIITRISRTIVSETLPSITDFNMERRADNSLFLSWINPTESYFSHNLITITILDLSSPTSEETTYVEDERIDKSETFIVDASSFNVDYRYNVTIVPYDVFGTIGEGYETFQQFTAESQQLRPSFPINVELFSGDTELYVRWNPDTFDEQELASYKIYRAEFQFYLRASDFIFVGTVPSSLTSFTDYTVSNGTTYSYFITAVDIYGNESLNPVADNYMPPALLSSTPTETLSLSPPDGLSVSANSNNADAELSWNATSGTFDGYEILRSVGNNYSFAVVDYVPISQTTYIDSDALLKDGETYYYLVRKYKSEVSLSVVTSSNVPSNSIIIGTVTTSNGTDSVSIDLSSVVNLENLQDPMTTRIETALETHHHTNDENVDKRVELRSNVRITDWTTLDYQVYSTEQDIEGATSYVLNISGTLNNDYFVVDGDIDTVRLRQAQAGESPVLYEIDAVNNKIVFNEPLYSSEASFIAPYSEVPIVSLELVGISEVDNYLPAVNVGEISATQFESGQFESTQMPSVHHEGRINERLLPLRLPMKTLDNFVYSLAATYENTDRNKMGDAITFYDVLQIGSDRLLAASSNGILLSDNYGSDWEQVEADFTAAVHRLYKSTSGDYYALTNYGVFKNDGTSFRTWITMSGLEYVKVIRDIIEDNSGNLYLSSDLGVFRLNSENVPYIEDSWEKLSIFGPRSSEAYALFYEPEFIDGSAGQTGRILVSNEIGLLQSVDNGVIWSYISDLEISVKIRKFIRDGGYIFALSDDTLYREEIGEDEFVSVASLDVNISRKMVINNGTIYITTDNGVQMSLSSNIYIDTDIDFVSAWSLININNNVVVATTINSIGDDIFVGTDRRLYMFDENESFWLQFEQKNTTIPTFYVDGELQKLGFYYNNGSTYQNVSFDEIVDHEVIVGACNKYDIYLVEYGGWAHNKYNAKFIVYQNGTQFGESPDTIEIDTAPFVSVVLPTYDDNNAHKVGADAYKITLQADLDQLTATEPVEEQELLDLVVDTYLQFELFLSQLYQEAKSDFVLPSITTELISKRTSISNAGIATEIEESIYASINTDRGTSYAVSINVVDGMFVFGIPFDKYDELVVDIQDVTIKNAGEYNHREIEDYFEEVYSGPPSYLSQVQQVNLVKLGLFTEKLWPGEVDSVGASLQAKYVIPVDDSWYDTLNSTINYTKQDYSETLSLSINYPSTVIYSSNIDKVLVGGMNGVLSINKDNLEIEEINFGFISDQMVRAIFENDSSVYILADKDIFISSDAGDSWSKFNRSGLPNQLYSIGAINNNLVIGASDGIYMKLSNSDAVDWEKAIDSSSPVTLIYSSNILFTVIDGKIYISANGFNYTDTGIGSNLDITKIDRYGYTNTYVSTNQGLYSDNGTFNSLSPALEEIDLAELLSTTTVSTVNDIITNNTDKIVVGISDGNYGVIEDDLLKIKESTSLDSIHRVLIVNNEIWLFGQDVFKVPYLDYPVKLSTGSPM